MKKEKNRKKKNSNLRFLYNKNVQFDYSMTLK